uniref:Citrate synthase n=1 Tax=Candidatus Kentrum eta TaxID=2126337 RepID=A0A450UT98_9GAMM|nr:MAG: citrate synthase [Candidatus Kentron sp. H]VFJ89082.1 MAG: citrate synthase [Candidatus Kentron sp. H]VFJ95771.1 MAG: citrate synthase [Candidatus Kentron sp. H]
MYFKDFVCENIPVRFSMSNTLTITDNRTGKGYEIPVEDGAIRAMDLRRIKIDDDDFGLMTYDPAYSNTAACRSKITFIDGDKGILRHRGYPIEQLAEKSSFLEVAYLLIYGELPGKEELDYWNTRVMRHTFVHQAFTRIIEAFHYDAHPMGILISCVAAMSTFHAEAKNIDDPLVREKQIFRILGKLPTLAAFAYRHAIGRPYNYPDSSRGYTANFLYMLDDMNEQGYTVHPVSARALDILFILHADHEQNCSASTMRAVGSSRVDPYSALAAATAALYGPLHGGANEAVLRMLEEIGSVSAIPDYIEQVKQGRMRLMGFGHRIYRNYDPRATIIKKAAHDVLEALGTNRLLDIALELERIALQDDYFVARNLYPNVDFYSGLIMQALGFPTAMFPVLFAIPRAAGWLAQWSEHIGDQEQRIARPRQVYLGEERRDYVPIPERAGFRKWLKSFTAGYK